MQSSRLLAAGCNVTEFRGHDLQSAASSAPSTSRYLSRWHSLHESTLEAVEYLPNSQLVHSVAPLPGPVSVIEPARQSSHDSILDAAEYFPAGHSLHDEAPGLLPVSVIEPASQALQALALVEPRASTNLPALQSVQAESVDFVEYFPIAQAVHADAPVLEPLSVIEPAGHGIQARLSGTFEN